MLRSLNRLRPYHHLVLVVKFWAWVYGGLNKTRQRNTGRWKFFKKISSFTGFVYYLPVRQQSLWCWCDVFSSNYWCLVSDSMILLPLRPASLTHKDSKRCKITYNMCPIGRKEWSIDLKIILVQYPVHVIFFLQINCLVTEMPTYFQLSTPCFLIWNSLVMARDSWFFTRWDPGLTITICNKITGGYFKNLIKLGMNSSDTNHNE